jgi:hypothetical protein
MGGVVDPDLLVYGTANLRIVDASIMPLVPAGHLQAIVYGVAEKVSILHLENEPNVQREEEANGVTSQAADIIKAAAASAAASASSSTVASAASSSSSSNTDPDQTEPEPQPSFTYQPEEPPSPDPTTTQPPTLPEGPVVVVTTVTLTSFVTVFI